MFDRSEKEILLYINNQLRLNFEKPLSPVEFTKNSILFSGKADGVINDSSGKIEEILLIKASFLEGDEDIPEKPYDSHVFQFSFHLYLYGVNTGYLCLCILPKNPKTSLNFSTNLKKNSNLPEFYNIQINPKPQEMRQLRMSFEILETWKNKQWKDHPMTLWKIRTNINYFNQIMEDTSMWLKSKKKESPKLTKHEHRVFMKTIRKKQKFLL